MKFDTKGLPFLTQFLSLILYSAEKLHVSFWLKIFNKVVQFLITCAYFNYVFMRYLIIYIFTTLQKIDKHLFSKFTF